MNQKKLKSMRMMEHGIFYDALRTTEIDGFE